MTNSNNNRRKFLATTLQSVGLTAIGGLLWSGYSNEAKGSPLVLRPPSAIDENDFLKACIKCGLCVEACKNRESNVDRITGLAKKGTLKMAKGGEDILIGTPYFIPREVPCYMCEDIPCVPVCPSGALDRASVSNTKGELDINMSRMGLAVVHKESCVAYWGIQCDACYRACPLLGEAITIEMQRNDRTGKHSFMLPIVHDNICTGCGLCEKACVTKKPAIFVLPLNISKGEVDSHYIKGWDKNDERRLEDAKAEDTKTELSEKGNAVDYLNSGGELY